MRSPAAAVDRPEISRPTSPVSTTQSVTGNGRVYLQRPRFDPPHDVADIRKALRHEMLARGLTADPVVAMEDEQRVARELLDVVRPLLIEMPRAFDPGDASFASGSHVPELRRSAGVQHGLQLLYGDLTDARGGGRHGRANLARLSVDGDRGRFGTGQPALSVWWRACRRAWPGVPRLGLRELHLRSAAHADGACRSGWRARRSGRCSRQDAPRAARRPRGDRRGCPCRP